MDSLGRAMTVKLGYIFALLASFELGGCGLTVPEMNILQSDGVAPDPDRKPGDPYYSTNGGFQAALVEHIRCSIGKGFARVRDAGISNASWLWSDGKNGWGTTVSLTLQVEELSGLNPSASGSEQWGIFHGKFLTYPETSFLGLGGNLSAHSTRAENITFSYANAQLLANEYSARTPGNPNGVDCSKGMNGIQIESDLKLDQFIWDKATVAVSENATSKVEVGGLKENPFGVFQNQLTFVASFGGNVTPTWHIEQVILNPSSPFFNATRTKTDTLIITLGPLKNRQPPVLADEAQVQHTAAAIGAATAGANKAFQ
jgi:hypothetical protein